MESQSKPLGSLLCYHSSLLWYSQDFGSGLVFFCGSFQTVVVINFLANPEFFTQFQADFLNIIRFSSRTVLVQKPFNLLFLEKKSIKFKISRLNTPDYCLIPLSKVRVFI